MKKNYELVCILDPQLGDKQFDEEVTKYETLLKSNGAEVAHIDRWGMRKLAYTSVKMKKRQQGYYVLFQFTGERGLLDLLQRDLKLDEGVLRYQIVAVKGEFLRVLQLPADILQQMREEGRQRGYRGSRPREMHRGPEQPSHQEESGGEESAVEEAAAAPAPQAPAP